MANNKYTLVPSKYAYGRYDVMHDGKAIMMAVSLEYAERRIADLKGRKA